MGWKTRGLIYTCPLRSHRDIKVVRLDVQVGRRVILYQLLARGVAILHFVVVNQIAVVPHFILIVLAIVFIV